MKAQLAGHGDTAALGSNSPHHMKHSIENSSPILRAFRNSRSCGILEGTLALPRQYLEELTVCGLPEGIRSQ